MSVHGGFGVSSGFWAWMVEVLASHPPRMQDQLDMIGSTDKTLLVEPEFGHIEHFMVEDHEKYVEQPLLHWMQRVLR